MQITADGFGALMTVWLNFLSDRLGHGCTMQGAFANRRYGPLWFPVINYSGSHQLLHQHCSLTTFLNGELNKKALNKARLSFANAGYCFVNRDSDRVDLVAAPDRNSINRKVISC